MKKEDISKTSKNKMSQDMGQLTSRLPQGWEVKKLGDVCLVIAGQSPESKYYNTVGGGLPFYQGKKDFTDKFIGNPTKWTTKVTKEAIENDILMSVRAPVGPVNFSTQNICIGRGLAAIRSTTKVDKDYLFSFLIKHENEIVGNSGAVFNSINKSQIENIKIPLPPLPEQKRIVAILDKAFTAIEQAKANTEQNLQNAKEVFESYLQSVFENRGRDWEEKKLGEVCDKIKDGAHHSPKNVYTERKEGLFPYITSKNIRNNYMDFSKLYFVDEHFHNAIYKSCKPEIGDVLLTKDGANTGNITLNTLDEPFSLLSSVCLIKPKREKLLSEFLKYYIQSPMGFKSITGKMTGAAIKRIILRAIQSATIPLPPINEQEKVIQNIDILSQNTQKLQAIYQQKLADLAELKKSLLQKAFNGELS